MGELVEVVIRPSDPHAFSSEELESLAAELRGVDSSVEVEVPAERGYGVTFVEVLDLWVKGGAVVAGTAQSLKIFRTAVRWLQGRWKKDKEEHEDVGARPRIGTLYDANGRVVKRVRIDEPNGEPVEESPTDANGE